MAQDDKRKNGYNAFDSRRADYCRRHHPRTRNRRRRPNRLQRRDEATETTRWSYC